MKILGYQPSRRAWLKNVALAVVGAPVLARLGRSVARAERRRRRNDVAPIPWIGHC